MPNYRKGFDVYDASTGIEEDISKVVIKDGEVSALFFEGYVYKLS